MQLYTSKPVDEFLDDLRDYAAKAGQNRLVDAVDDVAAALTSESEYEGIIADLEIEIDRLKGTIEELEDRLTNSEDA